MGYFLSLPQPGRIQRSSFIIRSFSALPNELVIKIRGFLIDPDDFESFALVSKWFRAISLPILKEDKHALLKKQFSRVTLSHCYYDGRLAELFRHFLENPKMKYYVRELYIESKWAIHWEELLNTTTAVLQQATQNSIHITPSLAQFVLGDTEIGKEGSLLALLFQRLSSLRKLKFSDIDLKDQHLLRTQVFKLLGLISVVVVKTTKQHCHRSLTSVTWILVEVTSPWMCSLIRATQQLEEAEVLGF